ncbi:MAG: sodium:solute symporter family protein [Ignavibacteria bacterium]
MWVFDWLIVLAYFIVSLLIGVIYRKKAGKSTEDFFLTGRNLPWWLAGLSMVATTFAADTPLAVTELVAKNGIAGNWLWWNMLIGGMLTVFFFSRLWRRAGIMTDVEFIELRYSGKTASFLRGFKAIYLGLFMNTLIMGWVNLAMMKILLGFFPEFINKENVLLFLAAAIFITAIYSAVSGLWGVAVTDAFQFILAMTGCIVLAIIVVSQPQIGGIEGLTSKLPDWALKFLPVIDSTQIPTDGGGLSAISVSTFLAYVGIQWWASWYPGAEPGGGGYVAQRMMSAKNEKHSLLATLFFQIAHYGIRPWPWIIVGLATIILYPNLSDKGSGYVQAMRDFLPTGLKGLLIAAFFAAYMSTIATHLNWGTSYLINDFYKRFIMKSNSEKHYVLISRLLTIVMMLLSVIVTTQMETISGVWAFLIECGAGLGLVLILRWFWWRINASAEIAATVTPFISFFVIKISGINIAFPHTLFVVVPITTVVWLITIYFTKPDDINKLTEFFRRVHPGGPGWKKFALQNPDIKPDSGYLYLFIDWILGIVLVYMFLFGTGKIIFGELTTGLGLYAIGVVAAVIIVYDFNKRGWKELV